MIKALIFDFDGLILDTEMPDFESWQRLYARFDQELPVEKWGEIVGGSGASDFDPHKYLESLIDKSLLPEEVWLSRRKDYLDTVSRQPILPGVMDRLKEADEMGLKLAVASSSPANWVHGHLNRLELFERFHTIKTADDVRQTKPNPELFQAALDEFGIEAGEAIVFEDSPNGILAAHKAGIPAVAVPNPFTTLLHFNHVDLMLDSLADQSLIKIIKKLNL